MWVRREETGMEVVTWSVAGASSSHHSSFGPGSWFFRVKFSRSKGNFFMALAKSEVGFDWTGFGSMMRRLFVGELFCSVGFALVRAIFYF